jgi:rod shape-determining protein MreD
MKYLIYFITVILLVGIHIGLFGYFKFFGVTPNVLLLFVVGCCLQREADDSFFIALVGGIFLDILSGIFVGSFTFAFLLLALLLYFLIRRLVVFELSWRYLLAVTILATIFVNLFAWAADAVAFHYGWSQVVINIQVLKTHIPLEIVYNLLLAYPLYALATWLQNFILNLQGKKHRIN